MSFTLVAVATYNEIESLPSLVEAIFQSLPDGHVLVVDDNSPDGTGRWCDERTRDNPRLKCLHRPGKLGLGSATIEAIHQAIDSDYDVIVTLDADWSHNPADIPKLVDGTGSADVMVGSRYVPGGRIEGWPLWRRVASRVLNTLNRWLLRLPVRDSSGAFRAYRVAKLRELPLDEIHAQGYAYLEEILWQLKRHGATFGETPIVFRHRQAGRSKMSPGEIWGKVATLGRLSVR
jgi:dolichol-phosphate mannosyltransferase